MIKIVNGIPEKLVEMDEQVSFTKQMDENAGPIILVNKFNVDHEDVDKFLEAFAATDKVLKKRPGYISAELHRGIGGSCVFLNYKVWESAGRFKQAVSSSEFLSNVADLPPSTIMSPHLFKKVAVPGICVE